MHIHEDGHRSDYDLAYVMVARMERQPDRAWTLSELAHAVRTDRRQVIRAVTLAIMAGNVRKVHKQRRDEPKVCRWTLTDLARQLAAPPVFYDRAGARDLADRVPYTPAR